MQQLQPKQQQQQGTNNGETIECWENLFDCFVDAASAGQIVLDQQIKSNVNRSAKHKNNLVVHQIKFK